MNGIKDCWETDDKSIRLLLGDCLEILPGLGKVDACVTDPPYGIGETSKKASTRENATKVRDYGNHSWDAKPISEAHQKAILDAGLQVVWFGGNFYHLPPANPWLVWDKLNSGDFADAELAWTNVGGAVRVIRHRWNGMIRDGEEKLQPRVHPTQKPIDVMIWAAGFTVGETILDPFMGSGTTGLACIRLGRRFVGIEKEPKYFEIAKKRIRDELDKTRLIETPKKLVQKSFMEGA